MKVLELRIPPPAIGLVTGAAMWGLARVTPAFETAADTRAIATFIGLAGLAFDVAGIVSFRRAKTTVNPMRPHKASALVTSGVYRLTRNPMYVGLLLILVAWAVFLSSGWALLGPLAFVLYMNRFQIGPEERVLQGLFGPEFTAYRQRVRRWL